MPGITSVSDSGVFCLSILPASPCRSLASFVKSSGPKSGFIITRLFKNAETPLNVELCSPAFLACSSRVVVLFYQ